MVPPADLVADVTQSLSGVQGRWEVMQGGTTNHVWRCGEVVVKLFRPDQATALFPNDFAQEALALASLGPLDLAPRLLAQGRNWIASRYQHGPIWRENTAQVAQILHRLHRLHAPAWVTRHVLGSSEMLGAEVRQLMQAQGLSLPFPKVAPHPPATPCFLHGDPVPGNIILRRDGPILIDWQCPAIGDPVLDLAIFLSPAMQQIYRGTPLSALERAEFLGAYPDAAVKTRLRALAPILHMRMALHCMARAARGDRGFEQGARLELAAAGVAA